MIFAMIWGIIIGTYSSILIATPILLNMTIRKNKGGMKNFFTLGQNKGKGSQRYRKKKDNLVGFFELIFHFEKKEVEIAYFGILEEYQNKKLGSFLLSEAIKRSFDENINRVWLHTCSLDHKNALNNYIARGMKIFKSEIVKI